MDYIVVFWHTENESEVDISNLEFQHLVQANLYYSPFGGFMDCNEIKHMIGDV